MKFRFWYVVVFLFCLIVSFIAYRAFVDFRERSEQTIDLEFLIHDAPLPIRCLLLDPNRLQVKAWHIGDYSLYRLKSNSADKTIAIQVVNEMDKDGEKHHWVKIKGIREFNDQIAVENWKLVKQRSFRRNNEIQSFAFIDGFIPIPDGFRIDSVFTPTIELHEIGNEVLKTRVGPVECKNYLASIVSKDGVRETFLELWVNADVRPLGIVQARWRDESIEIIEAVRDRSVETPDIVRTFLDGKNTVTNRSCSQCHANKFGGKNANFVGPGYAVTGASLDFTEAHFHAFQAGFTKMGEPIQLLNVLGNKRLSSEVVRFTWKKGSFSVKSDRSGYIYFSMDTTLHQSHLRAIPNQGNLNISFFRTIGRRNRMLKWRATVENQRLSR